MAIIIPYATYYLAVTLIWRFGSVALQLPIIVSANRRLHAVRSSDDSEEVRLAI